MSSGLNCIVKFRGKKCELLLFPKKPECVEGAKAAGPAYIIERLVEMQPLTVA